MHHGIPLLLPYRSRMEPILANSASVYSYMVAAGFSTEIFTFIGVVVVAWALYNLMSARRR